MGLFSLMKYVCCLWIVWIEIRCPEYKLMRTCEVLSPKYISGELYNTN